MSAATCWDRRRPRLLAAHYLPSQMLTVSVILRCRQGNGEQARRLRSQKICFSLIPSESHHVDLLGNMNQLGFTIWLRGC
jgi:hypothetical protein